MNSANCPRSGKFFCHMGALISKSQMELHHGCIIYVKLLFLPENSGIGPLLSGPLEEMARGRIKQAQIIPIFSNPYLFYHLCVRVFRRFYFSSHKLYCILITELKFRQEILGSLIHGKYTLEIMHKL